MGACDRLARMGGVGAYKGVGACSGDYGTNKVSTLHIEVVRLTSFLTCAATSGILSGKKLWARAAVQLDAPIDIRKVAVLVSIASQKIQRGERAGLLL